MTLDTTTLWERVRALPRATQWGIWAIGLTLVVIGWNDYIRASAIEMNISSERLLGQLEIISQGTARRRQLDSLQSAVFGVGVVEKPGRQSEASAALNDTVNQILKSYRITNDSYAPRSPAKLPRGTGQTMLTGTERMYKLSAELRFVASPADTIAIIAALEARPEIESVSRVRMAKQGSGKVAADLTIDAWIVKEDRMASGGRL